MRVRINYKELKEYKEPFTAVVDRGNGFEIWNYKTGADAERHKAWLFKKGIPTAYIAMYDNTQEAEDCYPEAETHGEQIKAWKKKKAEETSAPKEITNEREIKITLSEETFKVLTYTAKLLGTTINEIIERTIKKGIEE